MKSVPIDHPDLTTKELPAGIDPEKVAARKRTAMAHGTVAATAEANAIRAEEIQADREAHGEAAGVVNGQTRRPREHCPAAPGGGEPQPEVL